MKTWQQDLAQTVRTVEDLRPYLSLTPAEEARMEEILERFPMAVTPYYMNLIDFNDPDDPIRKMAIPSLAETDLSGSFDTSGEAGNTVMDGMQHKYAQTVMILSTNQCAMYCRHCFRKRLVGLADDEIARRFVDMRDYVLAHPEISNVLISGGDALLNSNARLAELLRLMAAVPHVDAIRIASRTPVVFPQRISADDELLHLFAEIGEKKQLVFVTQFNHPRELTEEALAAVRALQRLGIPVKNQSVLLRGVNAQPEVLGSLLRRLVAAGITPYYVFQCRPVSGVKNQFQVPLAEGWRIVEAARAMQSGLGKTFRYAMSHVTGKLEILGPMEDGMLFKYHEAHDTANLGRIFTRPLPPTAAWLAEDEAL